MVVLDSQSIVSAPADKCILNEDIVGAAADVDAMACATVVGVRTRLKSAFLDKDIMRLLAEYSYSAH